MKSVCAYYIWDIYVNVWCRQISYYTLDTLWSTLWFNPYLPFLKSPHPCRRDSTIRSTFQVRESRPGVTKDLPWSHPGSGGAWFWVHAICFESSLFYTAHLPVTKPSLIVILISAPPLYIPGYIFIFFCPYELTFHDSPQMTLMGGSLTLPRFPFFTLISMST